MPSTAENYNVDDLSSNDSTDDEEQPRKTIPQWARSKFLVLVQGIEGHFQESKKVGF